MIDPNPVRGCGTLVPGGFYLQNSSSPIGTLSPITWVLGNGVAGDCHPFIEIPPRGAMEFNPAATLLFNEFCETRPEIDVDDLIPYEDMAKRTGHIGIADHVGAEHYTAHAFVSELRELGMSRHVSPDFAFMVNKWVRKQGAVPVFFTHPQIPVFRSVDEREVAYRLAREYFVNDSAQDVDLFWSHETWKHPEWGMNVKYPWKGWGHEYVLILALVDAAYNAKKEDRYYGARKIIRQWEYQESWFVATWCNRVCYVLPEDRIVPKEVGQARLAIIDLEAKDE